MLLYPELFYTNKFKGSCIGCELGLPLYCYWHYKAADGLSIRYKIRIDKDINSVYN